MPRDSGGTYSLPAGNPVSTLSIISSTWANTTLSDLSTAMTGSLSRSGEGAMLAGLKLFDGVIGAPGLTWGTETTSGIYRAGAGDFRFAIGGADIFTFKTGGITGLFANGAVGTPAISWQAEPTSGIYRAGAGDFRWAIAGVDLALLQANLLQISGTAPNIRLSETDGAANNRLWNIGVTGEDMFFQTMTDAGVATNWMAVTRTAAAISSISVGNAVDNPSFIFLGTGGETHNGINVFTFQPTNSLNSTIRIQTANNPILSFYETSVAADEKLWDIVPVATQLRFRTANDAGIGNVNWLTVDRTGTTIDIIDFPNGTLTYGGLEVGYRNLIHRSFSGNDNSVPADRGRAVQYTGTGGHTFTFDTDLGTNHIVTVMNMGNGSLTIAESLSGTMGWMNGSGTISSGSRTLAVAGVATIWYQDASNCFIWGTGLT